MLLPCRTAGASGKQLQEAISINLSLHTLQNVVNALASGNGARPLASQRPTLTRTDALPSISPTVPPLNFAFALCRTLCRGRRAAAHIPFEDSTLTRKLKPCLSPGSMVAMLVTIRSEEPFKQESIRSLEMARTALRITCKSVTPLKVRAVKGLWCGTQCGNA